MAPADFEDAFREHFAPVYRFIARRVGTALAEDLAAEAFATAYRRRASYERRVLAGQPHRGGAGRPHQPDRERGLIRKLEHLTGKTVTLQPAGSQEPAA